MTKETDRIIEEFVRDSPKKASQFLKETILSKEGLDLIGLKVATLQKRCPYCLIKLKIKDTLKDEKVDFYECPQCKDVFSYEKLKEQEVDKNKPKNTCGQCSAYKTPFCVFSNDEAIIKKSDDVCGNFYPDRHIARNKLKKARIVQKRVE